MSDQGQHGGDPVMDEAARRIWEAGEKRLGPAASPAEALERARLAQDPRVAAVKHGLYLAENVGLLCERCAARADCELQRPGERCALEAAYVPTRRRQIAGVLLEDGQDATLHAALVESAIWAEIRLARAVRYLDQHGEFRDGGYSGVASEFPKLQRALQQALDALNLTPAARVKLELARGAQGGPGALARGVLTSAAERERRPAVDAEFSSTDDGGGGPHPPTPSPSPADDAGSGEGGNDDGDGGDDHE